MYFYSRFLIVFLLRSPKNKSIRIPTESNVSQTVLPKKRLSSRSTYMPSKLTLSGQKEKQMGKLKQDHRLNLAPLSWLIHPRIPGRTIHVDVIFKVPPVWGGLWINYGLFFSQKYTLHQKKRRSPSGSTSHYFVIFKKWLVLGFLGISWYNFLWRGFLQTLPKSSIGFKNDPGSLTLTQGHQEKSLKEIT